MTKECVICCSSVQMVETNMTNCLNAMRLEKKLTVAFVGRPS
jgi:hypothetical protein